MVTAAGSDHSVDGRLCLDNAGSKAGISWRSLQLQWRKAVLYCLGTVRTAQLE